MPQSGGRMTVDVFKLEMRDQRLIFISTKKLERSETLERALRVGGAKLIGPSAFAFSREITAQLIAEMIGELEAGECVYILASHQGPVENCMVVRPRTEGGIKIRDVD